MTTTQTTARIPVVLDIKTEPLDLVKIEPSRAIEIFTTPGALRPLLEKLAAAVRALAIDPSTPKGREEVKSLAYKIGKAKTYIEEQGVSLNRTLKEQPKLVDSNKKWAWTFLEALQAEIRFPVTAWEAEQAQVEAERVAAEAAAGLALEIDDAHEFAVLLDRQISEEKESARKAKAESLRIEAERRQAEADARAKANAAAEIEAWARREREAVESAARAEQGRVEAEERITAAAAQAEKDGIAAERRAKDAEERSKKERAESEMRAVAARANAEAAAAREHELAAQREARAVEAAAQRERDRMAAERKAEADAEAARGRDKEHKAAFNREAVADLIKATSLVQTEEAPALTEDQAKMIIVAIAKGKIRHVSVAY